MNEMQYRIVLIFLLLNIHDQERRYCTGVNRAYIEKEQRVGCEPMRKH